MRGEPLGEADLFSPLEAAWAVSCELDIIWRIGIDEIAVHQIQFAEVAASKLPFGERARVRREIRRVVDGLVLAEWNIETAATVEAAETVVACAVEIIKEGSGFYSLLSPIGDELIEARAMCVIQLAVVRHLQVKDQTILKALIEIDEMQISVIEECALRFQAEGDRTATEEGLNEPALRLRLPYFGESWNEPTLAARPFQRRR